MSLNNFQIFLTYEKGSYFLYYQNLKNLKNDKLKKFNGNTLRFTIKNNKSEKYDIENKQVI